MEASTLPLKYPYPSKAELSVYTDTVKEGQKITQVFLTSFLLEVQFFPTYTINSTGI